MQVIQTEQLKMQYCDHNRCWCTPAEELIVREAEWLLSTVHKHQPALSFSQPLKSSQEERGSTGTRLRDILLL